MGGASDGAEGSIGHSFLVMSSGNLNLTYLSVLRIAPFNINVL